MKACIKGISYHLPPRVETTQDLSREFPEWSADKIAEKTGIIERHIVDEGTCASDLGVESAKALFAEHGINPKEIEFILFCTQSPDYLLPTTACLMQDRLGIPQTAGALDFNLGCSGYVYGLALAKGLVETNQVRSVLLITAETYSKFISAQDKSVRSIFGDAATSTLVAASEAGSIGPFVFGTDGRGGGHLIVKTSGLRQRKVIDPPTVDEFGNPRSDDRLYMNGQEILSFTLRTVPHAVRSLMQKCGLTESQIDYYVFHQANRYMLDLLRKKLVLPPDKFGQCLATCGNTVSCSIPIALCQALKEGRIGPSMRVMLVGFGVGLSWAAGMIEL